MLRIISFLAMLIYWGCGITLFIFYLSSMMDWFGLIGEIVGIIFSPGVAIYPIIIWIVEDSFPTTYFMIWGCGLFSMLIAGLTSRD